MSDNTKSLHRLKNKNWVCVDNDQSYEVVSLKNILESINKILENQFNLLRNNKDENVFKKFLVSFEIVDEENKDPQNNGMEINGSRYKYDKRKLCKNTLESDSDKPEISDLCYRNLCKNITDSDEPEISDFCYINLRKNIIDGNEPELSDSCYRNLCKNIMDSDNPEMNDLCYRNLCKNIMDNDESEISDSFYNLYTNKSLNNTIDVDKHEMSNSYYNFNNDKPLNKTKKIIYKHKNKSMMYDIHSVAKEYKKQKNHNNKFKVLTKLDKKVKQYNKYDCKDPMLKFIKNIISKSSDKNKNKKYNKMINKIESLLP